MPELNIQERYYGGEFLISEANGSQSRDVITIAQGQVLTAGAILGMLAIGAVAAVAAAGNTGNGLISAVSAGAAGTQVGQYEAVCIEAVANAGVFEVIDPNGVTVGKATVGVAYAGQIDFLISDGAADFLPGDRFLITVAAGNGEYVALAPTANDGSENAACILWDQVDATAGATKAVGIMRHAEYNVSIMPTSSLSGPQLAAAQAQLATKGLIARVGI